MNKSILVAADDYDTIGVENSLPWYVPEELRRFRKLTDGCAVIMGRRTYESILARLGKPLPNRLMVVLSRNSIDLHVTGTCWARSVDEATSVAQTHRLAHHQKMYFVIGGASVYEQFL